MKDFAGKIAFITGGACGAGLAYAHLFAEAGMKVVIADNRQDHMDEALASFEGTGFAVHPILMDVTDREGYAAAADETEKVFGGVPDLLILNAGVNVFGPVEAATYDDFDWVTGVCYGGVVNGGPRKPRDEPRHPCRHGRRVAAGGEERRPPLRYRRHVVRERERAERRRRRTWKEKYLCRLH